MLVGPVSGHAFERQMEASLEEKGSQEEGDHVKGRGWIVIEGEPGVGECGD